jgi:transcriptional regulator with XRE-family HTH domain
MHSTPLKRSISKKQEAEMTEKDDIAFRLKLIREKLGLKQKDFAEKLNVSGPTLSDLEKGKYKPRYELFYHISKEYNVNLNYLLFGEGEMFVSPAGEIAGRIEKLAEENGEVKKFLWFFDRSKIFRFRILSYFNAILIDEKESIEKEIKVSKK